MPFRSDRRQRLARGAPPRPPEGAAAEGFALLEHPAAGPAGPRLAAAGAQARVAMPAADPRAEAVRDVAAGIAGPILVGYVLWLLLDARARGLERLYFLSRDGQVLKELADILAPRLGLGLERRYLHASRQAWNRALGTVHADRWLWNDVAEASPLDILRRLAVPAEAAAAELAALDIADPAAPLDAATTGRMRAWLASDGFAAAADAAAAESRALLEAYLVQEGLYDAAPFALVDLGWTGSQHQTLCELRAARGLAPPGCYLFGAKGRDAPWGGLRRGFYFDEGRTGDEDGGAAPDALPPRDLYALMETFCTAAEGTLTGFARTPEASRRSAPPTGRPSSRPGACRPCARRSAPPPAASSPNGSGAATLPRSRARSAGCSRRSGSARARPRPGPGAAFPGTPARGSSWRSSRSPTPTRSPTCRPRPGRRSGSGSARSSGSRAPSR